MSATGKRHKRSTWHEGLLNYVGGSEARRDEAERRLQEQGQEAGITFDFNVHTNWQPIDSQRMLLWSSRYVDTALMAKSAVLGQSMHCARVAQVWETRRLHDRTQPSPLPARIRGRVSVGAADVASRG